VSDTMPRTVAVIGAGTIGLGWISLFLANGLRVKVNSRRAEAGELVREAVRAHAPALAGQQHDPAELLTRLELCADLDKAVADVDVVQENAPEDLSLKQELFARIEHGAPANALLLSSTSTLLPDAIGAKLGEPGRALVGHPFNPPHVIPLVEVVGSDRTDPDTVARAVEFYRRLGKKPVALRRPIAGFAANRLQTALLRECIHLVREGVVTIEELDAVVTGSIGLRWAAIGPFQALHLGGGPGGLRHWLGHIGRGLEAGWEQLGRPRMDEDTVAALLAQADAAFGQRDYQELTAERDEKQTAILAALHEIENRAASRTIQAPVTADLYVQVQTFFARQMRLLDAKDIDGFVLTFTEDGVMGHASHNDIQQGRAAIAAALRTAAERYRDVIPRHWFDKLLIEAVEKDTVRVAYYAIVTKTHADGRTVLEPSCLVEDVLVRRDGELLSKSRMIHRDDLLLP
jgi:ketoreductase RED1